jgi:peptide/nickel transport system substrate-binding protein
MSELNYYAKLLQLGRMSRREFMGRALALGATTALATTLASEAVKAATPKKGGTLRLGIGHGSTTDTLDPATYENLYVQVVGGATHNKLTLQAAPRRGVPQRQDLGGR